MKISAILQVGLLLLCAAARAQVYDVKADFSTSQNPGAVWKYGWSEGISGAFVAFLRQHTPAINNGQQEMWDDPQFSYGFTPSVSRNPGSDYSNGNVTFSAGAIILHPCGPNGRAYAHVLWTAPKADRYKVTSQFFAQQNGVNVDVNVRVNGASAFAEIISQNGVAKGFTNEFNLEKGATIDFAVGPNGDFNPHSGNTGLEAKIVPLPPESCPFATIRVSEVQICWASVSNAPYRVEYQSEVTGGNWQPLFTNVLGTGEEMCVFDKIAPDQPRRVYRIACPDGNGGSIHP